LNSLRPSSGLIGRRRTYLTILQRAWSANFKMVYSPATSEAGIMSAKVVSCSNINGYLRNYQDCLTLVTATLNCTYSLKTKFSVIFYVTCKESARVLSPNRKHFLKKMYFNFVTLAVGPCPFFERLLFIFS
jgi:hypothetical protein